MEHCTEQSCLCKPALWLKTYKEQGGAMLHQDLQALMWPPKDTSNSKHKLENSQSFAQVPKDGSQPALDKKYPKVVQNQCKSKPYPLSCSICWSVVCETKRKDCPSAAVHIAASWLLLFVRSTSTLKIQAPAFSIIWKGSTISKILLDRHQNAKARASEQAKRKGFRCS